ncbi:hypothetical protein [Streptomyces flavidovirens]|uniref:hypothetical protein n=1 Tax=Streptomyces flavidovirens TaxID=67298 RepID=UPI0012FE97AA|nr:hypothetical protein [Streptomyces flavidovirens]
MFFLVQGQWSSGLRFLLGLVLLTAVAWTGTPKPYEAAFISVVLLGMWSDVGHWYAQVNQLDTAVHFAMAGCGSIVVLFGFLRMSGKEMRTASRYLPLWALVFLIAMLGLAAAALWEIYEWVVEQLAPESMRVSYSDTIADLVAGVAGSAVAGLLFSVASRHRLSHASED